MLSKIVIFAVILHVAVSGGHYFTIKSKMDGLVIDAPTKNAFMVGWRQKNCQKWTLIPTGVEDYYFIKNVATGNVLEVCSQTGRLITAPKQGTLNQLWHLDSQGRFRIALYANKYLKRKSGKVVLDIGPENNNNDKWSMVEVE